KRLKKIETNDRSAPLIDKSSTSSSGPSAETGPAIPGLKKPPLGLAPAVPSSAAANRTRSNSDWGAAGGDVSGSPVAPQLGGIFAGVGMPKLRKTGGGIKTGADQESACASDSETPKGLPSKPPTSAAPNPPTTSRLNALRPTPQSATSSPPQSRPPNHLVANLRKVPPKPAPRPNSNASFRSNSDYPPKAPPPPPIGAKPPPPPITSRKNSAALLPPPPFPAPIPPPAATGRPLRDVSTPPPAPPPPPGSAPPPPPGQLTSPYPSTSAPSRTSSDVSPSIAIQAARNAFGNGTNSPLALPPPPPTVSSPLKQSTSTTPSPVPSTSPSFNTSGQPPSRSTLDPSSYTLSNGVSPSHMKSSARDHMAPSRDSTVKIDDSRFHFQDESQLPKPRDFVGAIKRMRPSIRLMQHSTRITLFTRQNCSLCDTAKSILKDIGKSRSFDYYEIDVMSKDQEHWKNAYEFDTPVIHVQRVFHTYAKPDIATEPEKLMHRFEKEEVERLVDKTEGQS
ncbi:MAG: hypothetical protein Q9164_001723, partial [Protoblastenia rupestris]